jgi:hypothetical protein
MPWVINVQFPRLDRTKHLDVVFEYRIEVVTSRVRIYAGIDYQIIILKIEANLLIPP